jgi:hypothetical protein
MLGVVFAQAVTAAHACTLAVPASEPATSARVLDTTMPPDCAAMAKRGTTNGNVCDAHCAYGQQIDVHPDVPAAAIAPQPALTVRVVWSMVRTLHESTALDARSTAPSVSVLFSRFLI